jgi:uncharacterized membrane protein
MDELLYALTFAAAIGCGASGGVFFAFSAFVMKALARLPARQGLEAMQAINGAAVTPIFMTLLFGAATLCILLIVGAFATWHNPESLYLLGGGLLYLGGTMLVTIVVHAPRNDSLAVISPADVNGPALWSQYVRSWTVWNHVRAASALGSSALLIFAFYVTYSLP